MRVAHDLALLDGTVLGEEASNLILGQTGVNTSDEKVGTRVDGAVLVKILTTVTVLGRRAAGKERGQQNDDDTGLELVRKLYRSPPPGEAERRRVLSLPLSLRGEALRLSRS